MSKIRGGFDLQGENEDYINRVDEWMMVQRIVFSIALNFYIERCDNLLRKLLIFIKNRTETNRSQFLESLSSIARHSGIQYSIFGVV